MCVYLWLHRVFVAAGVFSSCGEQGYSPLLLWASHCRRVSCWGAWVPGPGLHSCGLRAQLPGACGIFLEQGLPWCPLHARQALGTGASREAPLSASVPRPPQCPTLSASVCSVCIHGVFALPDKKNRQFPDELQPLMWLVLKFCLPCICALCTVPAALSLRGGAGFLSFESGGPVTCCGQ